MKEEAVNTLLNPTEKKYPLLKEGKINKDSEHSLRQTVPGISFIFDFVHPWPSGAGNNKTKVIPRVLMA